MNHTLRARDLDGLLDQLPAHTQVLSLDCFDTLLWRKVAQPTDVFFSLQDSALFRAHGITADMRMSSESAARKKRKLLTGSYEVSLSDIYRELLPRADEALVRQAVDAEIACEIEHGFIYEPVLRLIRRAHQRGLRTIVVSDTYFGSTQLRHMLSELMGDECQLIQQIYCSSDAGRSKTSGIWPEILRREKRQPRQLFHLGDNRQADREAPSQFGIESAWLENLPGSLTALQDQRVSAALQVMPELRHTHALPNQFHAQLAAHDDDTADVATQIGYRSLGPVLHNFAHFIGQQIQRLQAEGRSVKTAFLLRDGHMPARVCDTLFGRDQARIQVSRFTSIAASLYGKEEVAQLLAGSLSRQSMPALVRQLLLPEDKARKILDQAHQAVSVELEFARLVLRDDTIRLIAERSRAFRERLLTHVKQRTGVQAGDTLVLVDLGYTGTVQNRLRRAFKEALDVDLFGLYLISKHTLVDGTDRQGLIDGREMDNRLITALTAHIGLLEMMCSNADPTTENYTEQGEPIHAANAPADHQEAVIQRIQSACLRCVNDMQATPERHRPRINDRLELARQTAADIARLVYFPSQAEIGCMSAFEFDFNLGTDLLLATANLEAGMAEYRREGFALMNRDFASQRIGYPLEMRYMDISLSTTLLSQLRFGYGIKPSEASFRREAVPTLIANQSQHVTGTEQAYATSDGFFSLHLPMSAGFDLSVLWGQRHEWLQLDSIQRVPLDSPGCVEDIVLGEAVFLDGVEQVEGTLVKFAATGMMYFPACGLQDHGKYMIRVVFRPLLTRHQAAQEHALMAA